MTAENKDTKHMINTKSIYKYLYKYITIFMVVFSIGFSSLHVIKADGSSLIYTNYTVKWVYDMKVQDNGNLFYIDMTISFDDYYSGYIYIYHTSYQPAYICVGAQVDSNTSNSLRVQFTDVNQIYMKYVFTGEEVADLGGSSIDFTDWLDGSMFTFTSASGSISISSNTGDVVDGLSDVYEGITSVDSTLATINSNIDGVESYLNTLIGNTDNIEDYLASVLEDNEDVESALTTINSNVSSIISSLSDANSNLTTIIDTLAALSTSNDYGNYLSKVILSQAYEIHDISDFDTTLINESPLSQSDSITLSTTYNYYIIQGKTYTYASFDYIVLPTQKKTTYYFDFSYMRGEDVYTVHFSIVDSVFTYTLDYYDASAGTLKTRTNYIVAKIYGTNDNPFANYVTLNGDVTIDNSGVESRLDETNDYLSDILDAINNLDITEDQSTTVVNNYETIENNNTTINNNLPDLEDITLPSLDLETISLPNIMSNISEDLESVSENIILPVYEGIVEPSGFDWIIKIGLMGIIIMGIRRLFR